VIIAIDFDGVLHDFKNPKPGRRMGEPIEGAKEALKSFKQARHKIIVLSVWGNKARIIGDWMKYYDLPFDEITNIKPAADWYIDDNGYRFENWKDTINAIMAPKEVR